MFAQTRAVAFFAAMTISST